MRKKLLGQGIIICETLGFALVILTLWLDELTDVPRLIIGREPTPVNYPELVLESGIMLLLGAIVIAVSARLLKRIKYLEGFLFVCSYCKRINVNGNWIPLDEFISKNTEVSLSHGLCPDCEKEEFESLSDTIAENFHDVMKNKARKG
jgi:hypothetical protein